MKRATALVGALGAGIFIGATYAFALQAKTTRATVELILAKFPSVFAERSNRATTTAPSNDTESRSPMEILEQDGEFHYTRGE